MRVEAFKELMQIELAFPMASMIAGTIYWYIYKYTRKRQRLATYIHGKVWCKKECLCQEVAMCTNIP